MLERVIKTSRYFLGILKRKCPALWPLICFNGLLSSVRLCAGAWYAGKIVNALLQKEPSNFVRYMLILVIVEWLTGMMTAFIKQHIDHVSDGQQLELESMLSEKATRLDYRVVESSGYQDQLSRAQQGISWVSGGLKGLTNSILMIFEQGFVLVSLLSILRNLPTVGICLLLLGIVLTVFVTVLSQRRDTKFRKRLIPVNRRLGYYLDIFKDVRIAKEVRLFAAQNMLIHHSREFMEKEWSAERNRTRFGNKIRGLITVVRYATQAMLYAVLGWKIVNGQMTLGQFSTFVAAGMSFYGAPVSLTTHLVELEKSTSFMNDYVRFMNLEDMEESTSGGAEKPDFQELRFEHVSFHYPDESTMALDDISMTIHKGEHLALVGGNGAGKSTLAKLICRFYQPTSGKIYLNGRDIAEIPIQDYRKMISAVFQDFQIFPFSLRDNVSAQERTDQEILSALNQAGLHQRVVELEHGLDTPIGKSFEQEGINFSGGEKQKLSIARALLRNGDVLLLDEPTAALAPKAEQDIFLRTVEASKNKTLIFISHRMSFCTKADRILLLHQGRLIGNGTHQELLNHSVYHQLWQAQAQYYTDMA